MGRFARSWLASALAFAVWAIVLVAPSTPRLVGDGPEYVAMAEKLARFEAPSLKVLEAQERGLTYMPRAPDHWYELVHFWVYPALAVPFVWLVQALHATPLAAFTLLNLLCLSTLLWVGTEDFNWPGALFLMTAPIWWWVDKAHGEVFTYTLLSVAFLWLPARPHWSMIALGLAATQNPPTVGVLLLCAAYAWRVGSLAIRTWATYLTLALAIAALHPVYYLVRMSRLTPLAEDVVRPTLDLWGYVIWDPNVGLLFGDPWPLVLLIVGAAALAARRRANALPRGTWSEIALAAAAALLFLFSFAQTTNVNHGGTPGMSRYALWLIPLTIPIWRLIDRSGPWVRAAGIGVATASAIWTLAFFRPAIAEQHLQPSAAALWMWTRYPGLNDPLPEIFFERLGHRERTPSPAATPGCEKVLLVAGLWPRRCQGPSAPSFCTTSGALCYANLERDGYDFVLTRLSGSGRPWSLSALRTGRGVPPPG